MFTLTVPTAGILRLSMSAEPDPGEGAHTFILFYTERKAEEDRESERKKRRIRMTVILFCRPRQTERSERVSGRENDDVVILFYRERETDKQSVRERKNDEKRGIGGTCMIAEGITGKESRRGQEKIIAMKNRAEKNEKYV